MPQKRIYLYVPFKDKEKARLLGAMWDDKEKKWFAPKSLDKNIFAQWLYPHQKKFSFDEQEILSTFKYALEKQGLIIEHFLMPPTYSFSKPFKIVIFAL